MVSTKNQQADGVVQILLDATQNFKQALTPERLFGWPIENMPAWRMPAGQPPRENWQAL